MTERSRKRPTVSSSERDRVRTREALLRASGQGQPDIERLVGAVPALLAEAERRRRLAAAPAARISSAAATWLPRLAAATVLFAVVAVLWPARSTGSGLANDDETASLDYWLVTGSAPTTVSDPLLDALVGQDR